MLIIRRPNRRLNGGRGVGSGGTGGGVVPPNKAIATETNIIITTEAGNPLVTET